MTEAKWLDGTDPERLLRHLGTRADRRRCLLFACACERRLWDQPDCERDKVEVTERFADGQTSAAEVLAALQDIGIDGVTLKSVTDMDPLGWALDWARDAATFAANLTQPEQPEETLEDELAWKAAFAAEQVLQCALLRDIFGDPFHPVRLDPVWRNWRDGLLVRMAQSIYEERAFERLPILADALEEAGCDSAELLEHLRSPGPHVRGCFALDALTGRT